MFNKLNFYCVSSGVIKVLSRYSSAHAGTGSWLQFNADFAAADVHTGDMTYTAVSRGFHDSRAEFQVFQDFHQLDIYVFNLCSEDGRQNLLEKLLLQFTRSSLRVPR